MDDKDKGLWDDIPSINLEMDDNYADGVKSKEGRRHHRADISTLKSVLHGEISSLPVRIATATNGVFDGMILDLRLPDIDGIKILRTAMRINPKPVVVIVSGHGSDENFKACMEIGATACFHKPVKISKIAAALRQG